MSYTTMLLKEKKGYFQLNKNINENMSCAVSKYIVVKVNMWIK